MPPKPHYILLDGLRGVAALIVIIYHVFECFSWSPIPHGYLAVDFFFVLSGFVIGYAYDDRWGVSLNVRGFFRRRLVRLHPMVVMGVLIGVVCFMLQGSVRWDGTHVGVGLVMLAMLLNLFLLPLPVGAAADVRGNGELFPLNGPHWSLFFEYIGNILYALLLRRLSARWLALISLLSGGMLVYIAVDDGFLGVGWSMAEGGFWTGFVRMLFPYTFGMLMARFAPSVSAGVKGRGYAFFLFSVVLLAVGCTPLLLGELPAWANGLYDALCVILVFPLLVWTAATRAPNADGRVMRFLGNLSYPLYAVHYPLMYLFYAYIGFSGELVPISHLSEVWPVALALPFGCILLGWLCMKFYDTPVRKRLA